MPEIVVSKMTSKNQITVPARVRDILCLEKGDSLLFTVGDDGSVSVRKAVRRGRGLRQCAGGRTARVGLPRRRRGLQWPLTAGTSWWCPSPSRTAQC